MRGRSVVFTGPGRELTLTEEEVPAPEPGQILVRTVVAGVCGTDAHRVLGDMGEPERPLSLGHEGIGRVEALGAGVTADRSGQPLSVGDLVAWSAGTPCGHCDGCLNGLSIGACRNRRYPLPSGEPNAATFREFATLTTLSPMNRIPDGVPPEAAVAFGCALPTAIGGFERLSGRRLGTVVVLGVGPVGLSSVLLASTGGADRVIAIDSRTDRLEVARRFGADVTVSLDDTVEARREQILEITDGRGADVVIEAAGQRAAFTEGLGLMGIYGSLVILGIFSGDMATTVDPVRLNNLNQTILGSLGCTVEGHRRAVDVVARYHKSHGFSDLISHRFPLDQATEAVGVVARGEAVKSILVF